MPTVALMTRQYAPSARARERIRPATADRTAMRNVRAPVDSPAWGDVEIRTWPTRAAMARQIRRDERNAPHSEYSPVVALATTEGY